MKAAGRSSVGRFVRRHREPFLAVCVTMPGAALLTLKIEAIGITPTATPAALGPAVAAAIAGALTISPRLQMGALFLARAVRSAVTTVLAAIGAAAAGAVLFWDKLGPLPLWTLDETVARLRADAPAILAVPLMLWIGFRLWSIAWTGRIGPAPGGVAVAFDRVSSARHEAAHALVASVLGVPFREVWSLRRLDGRGIGGALVLGPPPAVASTDALYGVMVRAVAVCVAGVAGDRNGRSMDAILRELESQKDWVQAVELSWLGGALRPDRVLAQDVLEAVVVALRTEPWKLAIAAGAKVLLRAGGDPVPPEAFAAIARRFGLALPGVEALVAAGTPAPEAVCLAG